MSMIRFTVDTGDATAVVTFSPEYGWVAAGDNAVLEMVSYEEIEPRVPTVVDVPVLSVPMLPDVPVVPPEDDPIPVSSGGCFTCGCLESAHGPGGCSRHLCKAYMAS